MTLTKVAIRSKQFNVYVSLNGTGITHYREPPYKNTVKTMGHAQSWEVFNIHHNSDDTVSFESSAFHNVFLNLDGNGVAAGKATPPGGGYAAAQYTARDWERFHIRRQSDQNGIVAIESAAFPGRFMRVDGGKSEVNVQGTVGAWELFEILTVG